MRFHVGPIPESTAFTPAEQGWRAMREPNPLLLQLVALPFLVLGVGVTLIAIMKLTPIDLVPSSPAGFFAVCVILVPVHELIHTACYPKNEAESDALIGFWPQRLLFYAHFDGPMTRNQFIAVLLVPTLVLTVLPVAVAACARLASPLIAWVALVNSAFAYGDLYGAFAVAVQVPRGAWVRNRGWRTYWRTDRPDGGSPA